jgi:hypothetical protein
VVVACGAAGNSAFPSAGIGARRGGSGCGDQAHEGGGLSVVSVALRLSYTQTRGWVRTPLVLPLTFLAAGM